MAGVDAVWGSMEVDVNDAPGRPDEKGDALSSKV
jgi:hypothetical protein